MIHKKTIQLTKAELRQIQLGRKYDIVVNQICDDGQLEQGFISEIESDLGEIIEIEVIIRSTTKYSPVGSTGAAGEASEK